MASAPQTTPAPPILKSDAQTPAQSSAAANPLQGFLQQVEQFLRNPLQIQQQIVQNLLDRADSDNPLGLSQQLTDFLQKLGIGNPAIAHDPTVDNVWDNLIANFLQHFGYNWNPAEGTLNGPSTTSMYEPRPSRLLGRSSPRAQRGFPAVRGNC